MREKRVLTGRTVDLPAQAVKVLLLLSEKAVSVSKGLGIRVFLVGGFVRDLLEKKPLPQELDLVVFGEEPLKAASFARSLARSWGMGEPIPFPRFGTYLIVGRDIKVEVVDSRLRKGWSPEAGDPLLDDALTRDFTLNALYVDLAGPWFGNKARVLDPGGEGLEDLSRKLLRTPVPASITFSDDPLRVFRAARFCATRSYTLDPSLARAAVKTRKLITNLAPERILSELNAILLSPKPSSGLEPLIRWGVLGDILPEIQGMSGFRQESPYHFPDLLKHSLRVVDRCSEDLPLRWAALLHDCGKPGSRVAGPGSDTYHGHEKAGAELAVKVLKRLKAGKKFTREVSELVSLHMVHFTDQWSDGAVRRFMNRAGEHLDKLLELVEADSSSLKLKKEKLASLAKLRERIAAIREEVPFPESPLGGKQIMDLMGIPPGPRVGEAKRVLSEALVEKRIQADEESAREFLLTWVKEGGNR